MLQYRHQHCYGDEIDQRIDNVLVELLDFDQRRFEYADNIRIAEVKNEVEVAAYLEKKERGCCGEHDFVYYDVQTGRSFMVGFNFGH